MTGSSRVPNKRHGMTFFWGDENIQIVRGREENIENYLSLGHIYLGK